MSNIKTFVDPTATSGAFGQEPEQIMKTDVMIQQYEIPLAKPLKVTELTLKRLQKHFWDVHHNIHHLSDACGPTGEFIDYKVQAMFLEWVGKQLDKERFADAPNPFVFGRRVSPETRAEIETGSRNAYAEALEDARVPNHIPGIRDITTTQVEINEEDKS